MRSKPLHTPGPWRLMQNDPGAIYAGTGKHPQKIAVVFYPVDGKDEARANAALIASAPDLLARVAELEEALSDMPFVSENEDVPFANARDWQPEIERARAVLARKE